MTQHLVRLRDKLFLQYHHSNEMLISRDLLQSFNTIYDHLILGIFTGLLSNTIIFLQVTCKRTKNIFCFMHESKNNSLSQVWQTRTIKVHVFKEDHKL